MLAASMCVPAASGFAAAKATPGSEPAAQSQHYSRTTAKRHRPVRRSKKKSAAIIGGSALGGAAIGGLAAGTKGAAIGALAGGGGGYVYDRKTQKKPVVPK
jgi:outer membrane lipoprotein SlyB